MSEEDYFSMDFREYLNTSHFIEVELKKLHDHPTCECCGGIANKAILKYWNAKGKETNEDLISLCSECRYVKGKLIGKENVLEIIMQTCESDAKFKKWFKGVVREIIANDCAILLKGEDAE